MGTRSLTFVIETFTDNDGNWSEKAVANVYRQMDGYPSGHGRELAEFLKDIELVNGISYEDREKRIANGAGCLAAQLVKHLKDGPGSIYLQATDNDDCGQDYVYKIFCDFNTHALRVVCESYDGERIFDGDPKAFLDWTTKSDD